MYIFGCVLKEPCSDLLFEKLNNIDSDGYDALGIAINENGSFACAKGIKSPKELQKVMPQCSSGCGIVHGRWATYGERTNENAHPFITSNICVAMNGTIENAAFLRSELAMMPYPDCDAAVLPVLVKKRCDSSFSHAISEAMASTKGNFAAVFMDSQAQCIIGVNHGAPLYVAQNENGNLISSQLSSFSADCKKIFSVSTGETVLITENKILFFNSKMKKIKKQPGRFAIKQVEYSPPLTLKEKIIALPDAVEEIASRYTGGEKAVFTALKFKTSGIKRVYFCGSGTSYFLADAAAKNCEAICDLPSFAFSSGEFCCSNAVCDKSTLFVAISASGETADTLNALEKAKKYAAKTLGVTCSNSSRLAQKCKQVLTCGDSKNPQCQSFSAMYLLLCLLFVFIGTKTKTITTLFGKMAIKTASSLADKVRLVLKSSGEIEKIAEEIEECSKIIIIGQNVDFSAAQECAQIINNTTDFDALAVPSTELRHTRLLKISPDTAVIALISGKELAEESFFAINQAKIRGAKTFVFAPQSIAKSSTFANSFFSFPGSIPLLNPVCHVTAISILCDITESKSAQNESSVRKRTLKYFAI